MKGTPRSTAWPKGLHAQSRNGLPSAVVTRHTLGLGNQVLSQPGLTSYKSHSRVQMSLPNMTGRPGYRTMEMNGGSSAPHLARTPFRNQEKGVLAKGFSAESSVTPKETKNTRGIGPSSAFGTHSATAKRGVHFRKNPLQKTLFSWFLTLAFPCFVLCLLGVETGGLLDYQGWAGIISIVRWNLRPVIFGVEKAG